MTTAWEGISNPQHALIDHSGIPGTGGTPPNPWKPPDETSGNGTDLTFEGGDATQPTGDVQAGTLFLRGGSAPGTGGAGSDVVLQPGAGPRENGQIIIEDSQQNNIVIVADNFLTLFTADGLTSAARPAIPTQVGTVSVSDFNLLRTALIALGVILDGD